MQKPKILQCYIFIIIITTNNSQQQYIQAICDRWMESQTSQNAAQPHIPPFYEGPNAAKNYFGAKLAEVIELKFWNSISLRQLKPSYEDVDTT